MDIRLTCSQSSAQVPINHSRYFCVRLLQSVTECSPRDFLNILDCDLKLHMIIRLAKKTDLENIRLCAQDAYEQYVADIGKAPAPMVADFAKLISEHVVHVAINPEGLLAGYVIFFPKSDHMYLDSVAVAHAARGQGLGKQLLQFCENRAKQSDLKSVRLYTNEKMTANLTLYPYLGYTEIDRRYDEGYSRVFFEKVF